VELSLAVEEGMKRAKYPVAAILFVLLGASLVTLGWQSLRIRRELLRYEHQIRKRVNAIAAVVPMELGEDYDQRFKASLAQLPLDQ
jgi:hypothetical protein